MFFNDSLSFPQKVLVTCLASANADFLQSYKHISTFCSWNPNSDFPLCAKWNLPCFALTVCSLFWISVLLPLLKSWSDCSTTWKSSVCSLPLESNRGCKYTCFFKECYPLQLELHFNRTKLQMTVLREFVCFPLWDSDLVITCSFDFLSLSNTKETVARTDSQSSAV